MKNAQCNRKGNKKWWWGGRLGLGVGVWPAKSLKFVNQVRELKHLGIPAVQGDTQILYILKLLFQHLESVNLYFILDCLKQ